MSVDGAPQAAAAAPLCAPRALRPLDGSFDWVRKANDPQSRQARLCAAQETQAVVAAGCYELNGSRVSLPLAEEAERQTRILSPGAGGWPALQSPAPFAATACRKYEGSCVVPTAAVELALQGRKVAAVSAASAHHVGGGFSTGGRHALEEAFCMQSTLYRCLQRAQREAGPARGHPYLAKEAAVLSPHVEVFRDGTSTGYAPMQEPVELACVISIAMPNLNKKVRDAPVESFADSKSYHAAVTSRWRAVLQAACAAGVSDLVCPDVGCGVYQNEAVVVGACLGELIRSEFFGHVETVWLLGSDAFCNAAKQALFASTQSAQSQAKKGGRLMSRLNIIREANEGEGGETGEADEADTRGVRTAPLSESNLRRWLQSTVRAAAGARPRRKLASARTRSDKSTAVSSCSSATSLDDTNVSGTYGVPLTVADSESGSQATPVHDMLSPKFVRSASWQGSDAPTSPTCLKRGVSSPLLERLQEPSVPKDDGKRIAVEVVTRAHAVAKEPEAKEPEASAASACDDPPKVVAPPSSFNDQPGADLAQRPWAVDSGRQSRKGSKTRAKAPIEEEAGDPLAPAWAAPAPQPPSSARCQPSWRSQALPCAAPGHGPQVVVL